MQTWNRGISTKWSLPFSPPPRPLDEIWGDFTLVIDAVTPSPATVDKPGRLPTDEINTWKSTMIFEKRGHRKWRLGALEQQPALDYSNSNSSATVSCDCLRNRSHGFFQCVACQGPLDNLAPSQPPQDDITAGCCWDLNFLAATGAAGWSWPAYSWRPLSSFQALLHAALAQDGAGPFPWRFSSGGSTWALAKRTALVED